METEKTVSLETRRKNSKIWEKVSSCFGQKYIIFVVLIVNMLNLISGFSFSWSSPVLVKLNETQNNPLGHPITPNESSLVGSLFYIGAAVGPLVLMQNYCRIGRKMLIVIFSLFLPIVYGVLALANNIQLYYVFRMVNGLLVGIICCLTPVYATEIIPANIRGSLMSLSSTFIQTGILLTYIIGPYVSIMVFNLIISAISVIFVMLFILTCPETPYYVMKVDGKEKAKEILQHFRTDNTDEELNDIKQSVKTEMRNTSGKFKIRDIMKPFVMATTLLVIQQFTGINVLIGYSQLIFQETNIKLSSAKCSIIVGVLQVASSFIVPVFSEKFPRKSMLCFSLFGLCLCNFTISLYFSVFIGTGHANWLPLTTLVLFVVFDNCGDGPLPWVLLGEIYPMHLRPAGPAFSTSIYYLVQFFLMFAFNKINLEYTFFIFGLCCAFGIIFVKYFVTETRGKSLREIGDEMQEVTPLNR